MRDSTVCALVDGRVVCQHTPAWQADDTPTATKDSQPGRRSTPVGDRGGFAVITGSAGIGCASGAAGTTCWDTARARQVTDALRANELSGARPFCAVSDDGVRCFDGLIEPPPARPLLGDVTDVSVGEWETCAVTVGGALLCWGGSSGRQGCEPAKPCRLRVE
ncbi:MAG: hypothetical protein R3B06_32750 [Kofleriaceae bacterium]